MKLIYPAATAAVAKTATASWAEVKSEAPACGEFPTDFTNIGVLDPSNYRIKYGTKKSTLEPLQCSQSSINGERKFKKCDASGRST